MSTDTQFVHMAWQRSEKFLENVKFQMAADPTGKVSKMFGVYDEATGLALRGTFIINPEGNSIQRSISTIWEERLKSCCESSGPTFILQSMEMRGAPPSGKRKETRP